MSVLIETSAGDLVIDLLVDYAPKLCENFLKLCKVKYYNFAPIHSIQKNFAFQTGDPLGPLAPASDGGTSIWGLLSGRAADRAFAAPFHPRLRHAERGTVSMATTPAPLPPSSASDPDPDPDAPRLAASQFLITLGEETDHLDGRAAVFGKVVEGFDVLERINGAIVDERGHPLVDIRIRHTIVLDDPYPDPAALRPPAESPPPSEAQLATVRIADEAELRADDGLGEEALERRRREAEARAQALTLEMMGDLPFAEVAPPENVLFVCRLNPVTTDADLELIFGRFGAIASCEVIRDRKSGDSLQYAFIEYQDKAGCEAAYFKMQDVLIDDRRIHVDFSQSVSRLSDTWRRDTNQKRKAQAGGRGGGGWGGLKELEKKRQYRDEVDAGDDDDGYRMVHRKRGAERARSRSRSRSRSPVGRKGDRELGGGGGHDWGGRGGRGGRGGGDDRDNRGGRDGRDNKSGRDNRNDRGSRDGRDDRARRDDWRGGGNRGDHRHDGRDQDRDRDRRRDGGWDRHQGREMEREDGRERTRDHRHDRERR